MRRYLIATASVFLFALTSFAADARPRKQSASLEVQILAFNDFHGNIDSPKLAVPAHDPLGQKVQVPRRGRGVSRWHAREARKGHRVQCNSLGGRPDRGIAARLGRVPRRADDPCNERASPRLECGRQPRVRPRIQRATPHATGRLHENTARGSRVRLSPSQALVSGSSLRTCLPATGRRCFPRRPSEVRRGEDRLHRHDAEGDRNPGDAVGRCRSSFR